jgi:HPt (histidine-containing phosphotransfer) domain-containing protein
MDGFSTARGIRALEAPGQSRVPILAMSAHAFDEYRLKAAEAGMDGYVMKPVDIKLLYSEMLRIVSDVPIPPPAASEAPAVDCERALKLLGGNRVLYRRMAQKFVKDWAGTAEALAGMVEAKPEEAHRLAHSLKGLSASLGAASLSQTAAGIEKLLHGGDTAEALNRIPALRADLSAAVASLAESCQASDN